MSVIQNGNTEAQSLKTHFLKLSTLIWNVALLCEHADFDKLRDTYPEAVEPVDLITDEVIYFDTFSLLVTIYSNPEMAMVRHQALGALGFLFRAYPSLMVEDEAVIIMDSIFNNQNKAGEERVRLIQVIQDFLAQQAVKADEDLESACKCRDLVHGLSHAYNVQKQHALKVPGQIATPTWTLQTSSATRKLLRTRGKRQM